MVLLLLSETVLLPLPPSLRATSPLAASAPNLRRSKFWRSAAPPHHLLRDRGLGRGPLEEVEEVEGLPSPGQFPLKETESPKEASIPRSRP